MIVYCDPCKGSGYVDEALTKKCSQCRGNGSMCGSCHQPFGIGHQCFRSSLEQRTLDDEAQRSTYDAAAELGTPTIKSPAHFLYDWRVGVLSLIDWSKETFKLGEVDGEAIRGPMLQEQTGPHDRSAQRARGAREGEAQRTRPSTNQAAGRALLGAPAGDLTQPQCLERFNESAHQVAEFASDFFVALRQPEYAAQLGGLDHIMQQLQQATKLWESCMDDATQIDCRDLPA